MDKGYIHLYYGEGKGKTSAAIGLAVRAASAGCTVCFAQFLKSGTSSELLGLRSLGVRVISGAQNKFTRHMNDEEKATARLRNEGVLREALIVQDDVLVLDEALDACRLGLLDKENLLSLAENKSEGLELVLTGHKLDRDFLRLADYVTEAVCHKHPFQEGVAARRGIEY